MAEKEDNSNRQPNQFRRALAHNPDVEYILERLKDYAVEAASQADETRNMYRRLLTEADQINKENEKAFQNVKTIRHKLIEARNLVVLLTVLVDELRELSVDHISLTLVEEFIAPDNETISQLPDEVMKHLRFTDLDSLWELLPQSDGLVTSYIGEPSDRHREAFSPDILSILMAPLFFRGRLIGCLELGSQSAERYASDCSTDLVEDLAITLALCLDNAIVHERNERLATTDPLTGIYNRRHFYNFAGHYLDLAKRHKDDLSCIYIDLNKFKPINDQYGHDTGDLALKKLSIYLKERIRRTDVLARLGGDEFIILLPRVGCAEALELSRNLQEGIEQISFEEVGLEDLYLSASMGVAGLEGEEETLEELINRADEAMFRDKESRDCAR